MSYQEKRKAVKSRALVGLPRLVELITAVSGLLAEEPVLTPS
ncbi:hypothetical protein [Actinomadura meridiana]